MMESVGEILDLRCSRRTPPPQVSVIHHTASVMPLDLSTPKLMTHLIKNDFNLGTNGSFEQGEDSHHLRVRGEFKFAGITTEVLHNGKIDIHRGIGIKAEVLHNGTIDIHQGIGIKAEVPYNGTIDIHQGIGIKAEVPYNDAQGIHHGIDEYKQYRDHSIIGHSSSIDSDSSFENEQESVHMKYPSWYVRYNAGNLEKEYKRRDSIESIPRPESVIVDQNSPLTDSEDSKDLNGSKFQFKNSLQPLNSDNERFTVLKFSSVKAEVIDVEDILGSGRDDNDNCEDDEEGVLQVDETCIEELFRVQLGSDEATKANFQRSDSTSSSTSSLSATIHDVANSFLAEIKQSKSGALVVNSEESNKVKKYCLKCKDVFYGNAALLRHIMAHSSRNPGEKLTKCPICTKHLCTVGALERHVMKMHTGEMPFVCDVCDAPFKFHTHLQKHLANTKCSHGIPPKRKKQSPSPKEKKNMFPKIKEENSASSKGMEEN